MMRDEESDSLWDHMTGECFEGALEGQRLEFWPVGLTSVSAELTRHPNTILLKSDYRSPGQFLFRRIWYGNNILDRHVRIPPPFRPTMHRKIDPRRAEQEQGFGIVVDDVGKYYPLASLPKNGRIEDQWHDGRTVRIERDALDGMPFATWVDDGEAPMQLLTRWYGFSFTYPNCEIYGAG